MTRLKLLVVPVVLLVAAAGPRPALEAANPCTNGSFEDLDPGGFPIDWSPVGSGVEVSSDAHSGGRGLRLLRTADTDTPETGLNRGGGGPAGAGGAMLDELQGGIDFWYKAIAADGADLNVYAIPMNGEPLEETTSRRAVFTVPARQVGDGRWHHGRLKYDFTDNPKVKWIHFAARIVGTAGELLLDDFSYVERVGAVLQIGSIRLEEDQDQPGERCKLVMRIENAGDAPAGNVRARMVVPDGFQTPQAEVELGPLAPDQQTQAVWTLNGDRAGKRSFDFTATSDDRTAEASLSISPAMTIKSFGPRAPVAAVGRPATIRCVLANPGDAAVLNPRVRFRLPTGEVTRTADRIPPGRTVVLEATFVPSEESQTVGVAATAAAENIEEPLDAEAMLMVGADVTLPPPAGTLRVDVAGDYAVLENEHVRLAFRRNVFGFGPAELSVARDDGWRTIAWLPRLGRVVWRDAEGARREHTLASADPPRPAQQGSPANLSFLSTARDADGAQWQLAVTFELGANEKVISTTHELSCDRPRNLTAFDGPMLYVLDRDEAVFPGLEWLVDDEVSSGTLDIARGHPHQERYVVHPNMVTIPAAGIHGAGGTVGLLWDVHQKWDGARDRPSVVFASPDRLENHSSHLMGLFLPTVPDYVEPNRREASTPYPMTPGNPLRLTARIFADGRAESPLAVIKERFRTEELPPPTPLPHGSYDGEIEFSMRAYLDSLWIPESGQWWTTKGMPPLSAQGRPRAFVADLLLGEIVSDDADLRRRCGQRAAEVLAAIGGEPRLDLERFFGRTELAFANPGAAVELLSSRGEDGSWRFDADQVGTGPFKGADYSKLGPDEALELGTCARKAFDVLRYARIAGDREAYQGMERTLVLMERFRVPRAAQVWEVPVHTPDVLAAADAVDAYLEAYRYSGNRRWLDDAAAWAERGLPFIYLWEDDEKPFLLGASIPVFGATWYNGSWFGCPVQWNGLRYANAILSLAEYDRSYPWREIAERIIRSGIQQQELDGENVALWPDNINAIDSAKCPWLFAPRQIIRNVLKLTGRDEDPATVIVGRGETRFHVTAVAKISEAEIRDDALSFRVVYPKGQQGVVLVANLARPSGVLLEGEAVVERRDVEQGTQPGWRYDAENACLAIRVGRDGATSIRVEGAATRSVSRLPEPVEGISFEFDTRSEGWSAANDVGQMAIVDGALTGRVTGPDPYLVRTLIRAAGSKFPTIRIRLRVTAGQGGQFFWTTAASPAFAEDKQITFPLVPDGQFHEYRLDGGSHPAWSGQTITGIRIDPGGGAPQGEFAIDYVRGGND
jgi:hypothetical protein